MAAGLSDTDQNVIMVYAVIQAVNVGSNTDPLGVEMMNWRTMPIPVAEGRFSTCRYGVVVIGHTH